METFVHQNLILGINEIINHIDQVSIVVLFRCEVNEVLLEPLLLLCKTKNVKCLSGSFQVAYEKMRELTGVSKLAALALPKVNSYPLTEHYLNTLIPKQPKSLLPLAISSKEIIRKSNK